MCNSALETSNLVRSVTFVTTSEDCAATKFTKLPDTAAELTRTNRKKTLGYILFTNEITRYRLYFLCIHNTSNEQIYEISLVKVHFFL